jgi:hypothetical protein
MITEVKRKKNCIEVAIAAKSPLFLSQLLLNNKRNKNGLFPSDKEDKSINIAELEAQKAITNN